MRIRDALAPFVAALFLVSLLACGNEGGGNSANVNGRNSRESDSFRSTINSENPLIGTWVSGEHSLTFQSDNRYSCDLDRDGIPAVWGSYMISGNVVIFSDAVGSGASNWKDGGQIISGTYTYTMNGNTLTFSPVLNLCRDRINILCLSYQKKGYESDHCCPKQPEIKQPTCSRYGF